MEPLPELDERSIGSNDAHDHGTNENANDTSNVTHESDDATIVPRRTTLRAITLVLTCTMAMIVNTSNTTSVSISLPTIGRELNITEARLQWLISAYALSSGCLLLVFGRLADLYGRKRMFMLGCSWLAFFSLICGFSKDEITLDVLRALQGVGAAATIPASLGILAHAFAPSRTRSLAFACFAAGAPIGAGFGQTMGGLVTQLSMTTWRSTFYISAGITTVCLVGGIFSFDADVRTAEDLDQDRRIDWLGAALITSGLVLIIFVLAQGELAHAKWRSPYIVALLLSGILLILMFILWERHLEKCQKRGIWSPPPLVKVSMWARARGRFAVIMLIAFLEWSTFSSWSFWAQLYYQQFVGLSPLQSVIRFLPMFITGIACNGVVALLVGKVPVVFLIVTGTTFTGAACALFALINPAAPYWAFGFPAAIITVFGADFVFASGTLFVAKIAKPEEQSVAGALFQTMIQLGTSFGTATTTIAFNRVMRRELRRIGGPVGAGIHRAPKEALLHSFKAAQWTAFSFSLLAAILAALFLWDVGIVGHAKAAARSEDADDSNEKTTQTAIRPIEAQ